jgi:rhodanese-related sulfurtransferase
VVRSTVLVLVGAAVGLSCNYLSGSSIPWIVARRNQPLWVREGKAAFRWLTISEAETALETGNALLLDAREEGEYARGHAAGAIHLSVKNINEDATSVLTYVPTDAEIIALCDPPQCSLAMEVLAGLSRLGYVKLAAVDDGWGEWREAGFPVEEEEGPP